MGPYARYLIERSLMTLFFLAGVPVACYFGWISWEIGGPLAALIVGAMLLLAVRDLLFRSDEIVLEYLRTTVSSQVEDYESLIVVQIHEEMRSTGVSPTEEAYLELLTAVGGHAGMAVSAVKRHKKSAGTTFLQAIQNAITEQRNAG